MNWLLEVGLWLVLTTGVYGGITVTLESDITTGSCAGYKEWSVQYSVVCPFFTTNPASLTFSALEVPQQVHLVNYYDKACEGDENCRQFFYYPVSLYSFTDLSYYGGKAVVRQSEGSPARVTLHNGNCDKLPPVMEAYYPICLPGYVPVKRKEWMGYTVDFACYAADQGEYYTSPEPSVFSGKDKSTWPWYQEPMPFGAPAPQRCPGLFTTRTCFSASSTACGPCLAGTYVKNNQCYNCQLGKLSYSVYRNQEYCDCVQGTYKEPPPSPANPNPICEQCPS